jgi:ATP-dependent protease ClpP protease subunit
MAKELYLYSPIYDFVAEALIASMEESAGEDLVIRLNTPGGNVFAGWGIIAKMLEHEGKIKLKVDGTAMSMGAMMTLFSDDVEVLDVTNLMFHKASMYVSSPEDQAFLDTVNGQLKAKMKKKVDSAKLKEMKGVTVDELFDGKDVVDIFLTAKEAKELGIVKKINKVNPKEIEAFNQRFAIAAQHTETPTPNTNKMTTEEIKAKYPEAYSAILKSGVDAERDRVGAFMAFHDIDPETVSKGIKDGTVLSHTAMAEFTRKAMSKQAVTNLEKESPGTVTTTTEVPVPEAKKKALEDFEKAVDNNLKTK